MKARSVIIVLLSLLCAPAFSRVQPKPADVQSDGPKTELRAYDVRSLVTAIRDYPSRDLSGSVDLEINGASLVIQSAMPTTMPNSSVDPSEERIDELVQLIQELVASDSWRDNGGTIGHIRRMGSVLLVTQQVEVHQQISELLRMLPQRGRMARVRAMWVQATRQELEAANLITASASAVLPEVDLVATRNIMKSRFFTAETVCFTGQTVYVSSGKTHRFVSDLNPVVGQNAVGIDPTISEFLSGTMLQVTPTLGDDGKSVMLDVHSRVTEWSQAEGAAGEANLKSAMNAAKTGGETMIDKPATLCSELHTTARIPTGKGILIGGMTLNSSSSAPASGPDLLLIVEVLASE